MELLNIGGFNVLHMPHPSDLISVRVAVSAGSSNEDVPADYGVAHFLEHMFFKGTKNKGFKELNSMMSRLGEANAYTSQYLTAFYLNTTKGRFQETADLLAEFVFEPAFSEAEFQKERGVILEELQSGLDDPNNYFWYKSFNHVYGDVGHDIIGSKATVSKMKLDQLVNFRNRFYGSNNMLFIVSGNVSKGDVKKVMSKALKHSEKAETVQDSDYREPAFVNWEKGRSAKFKHAAEQAFFTFFMRASAAGQDADFNYAPVIFNNALGGGLHSVLGTRIREELGLCYSVWAGRTGFPEERVTVIGSQLKKENVKKAKDAVLEELAKIKKDGFEPELIETAKSNAIFNLTKEVETADGHAKMFGDDYLQNFDIVPPKERSLSFLVNKYQKVKNKDLIEYGNWVCEEGHKFTYMA